MFHIVRAHFCIAVLAARLSFLLSATIEWNYVVINCNYAGVCKEKNSAKGNDGECASGTSHLVFLHAVLCVFISRQQEGSFAFAQN